MKNLRTFFLLFGFVVGCSSAEKDDYDIYHPSTLHPAANSVEGFYLDADAPVHPVPSKKIDFWVGGCSRDNAGGHYSKTAYSCANR